jgi:hypothetical protein
VSMEESYNSFTSYLAEFGIRSLIYFEYKVAGFYHETEPSPRRQERSHDFFDGCYSGDFSFRRNDDVHPVPYPNFILTIKNFQIPEQ